MNLRKLSVSILALAFAGMAKPVIKATADRADAIYKCGEQVTFTVQVTDDQGAPLPEKITCYLTNDNRTKISTQELPLDKDGKATISGTMDKPSFLRMAARADYSEIDPKTNQEVKKQAFGVAAAGFEPLRIQPAAPAPKDFNEWWQAQVKLVEDTIPLDAQMIKMDKYSNDKRTCYEVSFAAPDGRVYGFLNIPNKPGQKLPALVDVPGAGPGAGSPIQDDNFVTLVLNVHPYDPVTPGKTVKELYDELNKSAGDLRIYMNIGMPKREKLFYYRAILGINRAVNWLAQRPEVDPKRIGYFGSSQGGAFGFILGGLNPNISALLCNVPAMCDHHGAEAGRAPGWPQYANNARNCLKNEADQKEMLVTMDYYDALNFARNIKQPIRVIVGFIDTTCSPSSVYAAFNSIQSTDKAMTNEIDMTHSGRASYYKDGQKWLRDTITK